MAETCRIVIIGGGFAGLEAARARDRAPVAVTLIDRQNHHCFQPLLYQVAALTPADIAWPIRQILSGQRNVRVPMANVEGIDAGRRLVRTGSGDLLLIGLRNRIAVAFSWIRDSTTSGRRPRGPGSRRRAYGSGDNGGGRAVFVSLREPTSSPWPRRCGRRATPSPR